MKDHKRGGKFQRTRLACLKIKTAMIYIMMQFLASELAAVLFSKDSDTDSHHMNTNLCCTYSLYSEQYF